MCVCVFVCVFVLRVCLLSREHLVPLPIWIFYIYHFSLFGSPHSFPTWKLTHDKHTNRTS